MPKRTLVRRGRQFWLQLVEEFEEGAGAERHQEFADRHGVRCDTFRRWLYLLRAEKGGRRWRSSRDVQRSQVPTPWPLVEVQSRPVADGRFEIDLPGGRRLRVPTGFDADALRQLLAVLDGAPTS